MSNYIYFTEDQKRRAIETDLVDFLHRQGEQLKRIGKEYQWRDGCDKVTIRGNLWYHQYECVGGNAIDFVEKFYDKNYQEAITFLLGEEIEQISNTNKQPKNPRQLILPERNENMNRVFSYLVFGRGIERSIIHAFAHKKMIYESSTYHNAVFVGYDADSVPRHAHKRGTGSESNYKCNASGSMPEYSFHWNGTNSRIFLFEAPIDMLSYITMNPHEWKKNTYAASCSVSDKVLYQCLKDNPNIKDVYICFDNDEAGQTAAKRISDKLFIQGYNSEILIPNNKDWNEDLIFNQKEGIMEWDNLTS